MRTPYYSQLQDLKNLILFSISFSLLVPNFALGKTLKQYQEEFRRLEVPVLEEERRANEAERQRNEVLQRVIHLRSERDRLKTIKDNRVEFGRQSLQNSGNKRIKGLKEELEQLRVDSLRISAISREYSKAFLKLKESYESLLKRFSSYQSSEPTKKARLARGVEKIDQVGGVLELFALNTNLDQLMKEERSIQSFLHSDAIQLIGKIKRIYQTYERNIAPFEAQMRKYQIPKINSPERYLGQLQFIQNYSSSRSAYFSERVIPSLRRMENRMRALMNEQVASITSEREKREIYSAIKVAFNETVKELMDKEIQVIQQAHNKVSPIQKIKPKFEVYQEILSYQNLCSDLEKLYQERSPYYAGCAILQPLFHSAQLYMEKKVWRELKSTISFVKKSNFLKLQGDLDQLSEAIKTNQQAGFSKQNLLDAIRIHDHLIFQWKELEIETKLQAELQASEEGE